MTEQHLVSEHASLSPGCRAVNGRKELLDMASKVTPARRRREARALSALAVILGLALLVGVLIG